MNAISPNATTAQRLIFVAVVFPKVDIAIVGWQHSIIKSNMLKHAASMSQLPEWWCCLSYRCRSPGRSFGRSIHSTDTTLGICVFVFRKLNNIPKSFIIQQLLRMQPGNHPPTLGWLGNPNQNAYCYQPSIPQTPMPDLHTTTRTPMWLKLPACLNGSGCCEMHPSIEPSIRPLAFARCTLSSKSKSMQFAICCWNDRELEREQTWIK